MNPRILFIDDDLRLLNGIKRMLTRFKECWDIFYESDAVAGSLLLDHNEYDVVVLDVKMPRLSGFDLLAKLKKEADHRATEVIMLTGLADHDLKRKALDMGATDLLNKPVQADDLIARIRSVLKLKQYRDSLKIQNEILKNQLQQIQKTQLIGVMAAGVIHDLKNFMGIISSISELALLDDGAKLKDHHDMQLIHMSSKRALDILMRIHQFSKSNNQSVHEVVDIRQPLLDCIQLMQAMASKTVKVDYDWDEKLDYSLSVNHNDLFQIFMNLGLNAIQSIGTKGRLSIHMYLEPHENDPTADQSESIVIEFQDTGKGIPASDLDTIFQSSYSTKAESGGSGLGLFIVKSIVEKMDGIITVSSELGQGTTFRLQFKKQ